ncbi:uncharacterized protein BHQ10_007951 [Talaromyces amestolkiae]|uniref:AGC-kinase C-terminal domain-containing protein n=1 Tax=Talaromyces amestolkiae TaxID=1196081 RepID=A0A364L822_TALAM|nr:uncharacterized protein BHQ10_007951 [Talaromyces amestolkiae]RAO71939.1 hypothetical protein BHQ10_007951 [Talaromyces amestolkiae]
MPKRNNRLVGAHSEGATSINEVSANTQTSNEKARPQSGPWNSSQKESLSSGACLISKIRRGKVKLLSKLGLWNSGDTEETDTTSSSPLDLNSLCSTTASQRDADDERTDNVSNCFCPSSNDFPTTIEFHQQPISTPGADSLVSESFELAQVAFENEFYMHSNVDRPSRIPVLARRLSQKLSIFGPSTVIRRTKTKARPGSHVYSDDATDIKSHRWFLDHSWNDMLLRRPPYVPEERCWEDIRLTDTNPGNIQEKQQSNDVHSPPVPDPLTPEYQNMLEQEAFKQEIDNHVSKKRKHKERKRARDKILRDAVAGPTALDVRTKGAFVGYTWRRPKSVRDVLEIERGRSLVW